MPLSREEFQQKWSQAGEDQADHAVEAAWKRYELVQSPSHITDAESDDPTTEAFLSGFQPFITSPEVVSAISGCRFLTLPANRIPWTSTNIQTSPEQEISTFVTGRVWRSKLLDLYAKPQPSVWFKIGNSGTVFNSTQHSNTFRPEREGELYVANQFPGQFGEPDGGRLIGELSPHHSAEGSFEVLIIVWKPGVNVSGVLESYAASKESPMDHLIITERERLRNEANPAVPPEWKHLWFLGTSRIFQSTTHAESAQPCMHCRPYDNVAILQKEMAPAVPFHAATTATWDWNVAALPSRLREDLSFSHDYLSVAFEFENGRDITYTWSWELPKDYGYWCPFPGWTDREYHVVIRSGTQELGQWVSEKRDLYADYIKYIEAGKEDPEGERVPKQITKVWFIAANRWQRFDGDMTVKQIKIAAGGDVVEVL